MKLADHITDRTRKNHTVLLNAIAEVGQNRIADLLGESDTTISRFKAELERCAAIMAAVGLKLVPEGRQYLGEEYLTALQTLAKRGISAPPSTSFGDLE